MRRHRISPPLSASGLNERFNLPFVLTADAAPHRKHGTWPASGGSDTERPLCILATRTRWSVDDLILMHSVAGEVLFTKAASLAQRPYEGSSILNTERGRGVPLMMTRRDSRCEEGKAAARYSYSGSERASDAPVERDGNGGAMACRRCWRRLRCSSTARWRTSSALWSSSNSASIRAFCSWSHCMHHSVGFMACVVADVRKENEVRSEPSHWREWRSLR